MKYEEKLRRTKSSGVYTGMESKRVDIRRSCFIGTLSLLLDLHSRSDRIIRARKLAFHNEN